jgi:hypothetical protein
MTLEGYINMLISAGYINMLISTGYINMLISLARPIEGLCVRVRAPAVRGPGDDRPA